MLRRHQWLAIALGLLLLGVDGLLARGQEPVRPEDAPPLSSLDADPELLRARIGSVLEKTNPRLGSVRSDRIAGAVLRCAKQQQLAPDLVLAVILVESNARPAARSPKGAIGLMQVMPHMFKQLSLPGNIAHIEANIEAGCLLLADNIRRLGEADGISAYFWGSWIRGEGYLKRVRTVRGRLARPDGEADARGRG